MNIMRNGYIYDTVKRTSICHVREEKMIQTLSADEMDMVSKAYRQGIIVPCFRLYVLHEDETPSIDISSDFVSGSLSVTYQSGQRRTLSVTLVNKDNRYKPDPINSIIWIGTKFRLDAGIIADGTLYWKQQGVFVLNDPSRSRNGSQSTISLSLCDKFGMLDGTVYGRTSLRTIVPQGVSVRQAFYTILGTDIGNGHAFDVKPIHFDSAYYNINTYYTIKQEAGQNIGDILTEMGESLACDVYYDEYGYMCVKSNQLDFINNNFPVAYIINEADRGVSFSMTENWSKMRNKIIVKGNIANGYQFTATSENRSLKSPFCIQYNGEVSEVIEDGALYSDTLCMDRAMYEMIKSSRGVRTLNITFPFMPLMDVNQSVLVTSVDYELNNTNFVIDSISMDIGEAPTMSLSLTNMNEVTFV